MWYSNLEERKASKDMCNQWSSRSKNQMSRTSFSNQIQRLGIGLILIMWWQSSYGIAGAMGGIWRACEMGYHGRNSWIVGSHSTGPLECIAWWEQSMFIIMPIFVTINDWHTHSQTLFWALQVCSCNPPSLCDIDGTVITQLQTRILRQRWDK